MRDGAFARGDVLPHLTLEDRTGAPFSYRTIWQQRNLLLVVVGDDPAGERYALDVQAAAPDIAAREAVVVVTRTPVPGLSVPGVLVVDRWARVIHAAHAATVDDLPPVHDLVAWLDYVQMRCG